MNAQYYFFSINAANEQLYFNVLITVLMYYSLLWTTIYIFHHKPRPKVLGLRPSNYNFPPFRGRRGQGFEIKRNGELVLYEIGPDDRPVKKIGKFKVEGPNRIKVYFEGKSESSFSLGIVAFEENNKLLRVERL
jgi:hypothetical protein